LSRQSFSPPPPGPDPYQRGCEGVFLHRHPHRPTKTVAHGWRQNNTSAQISDLGRQLYDRLRAFLGHIQKLGRQLGSATDTYNDAVGSLERNVLPGARRFRDLGAATGPDLPELEPTDTQVRALVAPEAAPDSEAV
jgi:DNA recombination protein RmuC